jgi:hypothetical protein
MSRALETLRTLNGRELSASIEYNLMKAFSLIHDVEPEVRDEMRLALLKIIFELPYWMLREEYSSGNFLLRKAINSYALTLSILKAAVERIFQGKGYSELAVFSSYNRLIIIGENTPFNTEIYRQVFDGIELSSYQALSFLWGELKRSKITDSKFSKLIAQSAKDSALLFDWFGVRLAEEVEMMFKNPTLFLMRLGKTEVLTPPAIIAEKNHKSAKSL